MDGGGYGLCRPRQRRIRATGANTAATARASTIQSARLASRLSPGMDWTSTVMRSLAAQPDPRRGYRVAEKLNPGLLQRGFDPF